MASSFALSSFFFWIDSSKFEKCGFVLSDDLFLLLSIDFFSDGCVQRSYLFDIYSWRWEILWNFVIFYTWGVS